MDEDVSEEAPPFSSIEEIRFKTEKPISYPEYFVELGVLLTRILPSTSAFYEGKLNTFQCYSEVLQNQTGVSFQQADLIENFRARVERLVRMCYGQELDVYIYEVIQGLNFAIFDPRRIQHWYPRTIDKDDLSASRMMAAKDDYHSRTNEDRDLKYKHPWEVYETNLSKAFMRMLCCGLSAKQVALEFGAQPFMLISLETKPTLYKMVEETKLNPPKPPETRSNCVIV